MLARWVLIVWGAWLGVLGLATALAALQVWNSSPILPVGLLVLMLGAWLGLVIAATVRLIRGPRATGLWWDCSWGRRRSGSWSGTS